MHMNVCIFSSPRSASTYLARMLIKSPDLSTLISEPFNIDVGEQLNVAYIKKCRANLDLIKSHTNNLLIKDNLSYYIATFYYSNSAVCDIIDEYHDHINRNFYKIKLIRNDIFEQALSNCIAVMQDIWSYNSLYDVMPTLTIDKQMFIDTLHMYMDRHNHLRNHITGHTTIYYDQLTNDTATDWKLFDAITPPEQMTPADTDPNPEKSSHVTNYYELYQWFLEHQDEYQLC